MRRCAAVALAAAMSTGCLPDLGPCDPDAARALVRDDDGLPSYEGQALVRVSCSSGADCHSAGAEGIARRGVPLGFDFDVTPMDSDTGSDPAEERILRRGITTVRTHARSIHGAVLDGSMPPFGPATEQAYSSLPRYTRADGTRLPWIDSVEGVDILRNWLACEAPFVERTSGEATLGGEVVADE